MIELILALLCSASMAIALRLSGRPNSSRYGLLVGNYLTCVLMAWLSLSEKTVLPVSGADVDSYGFRGIQRIYFSGGFAVVSVEYPEKWRSAGNHIFKTGAFDSCKELLDSFSGRAADGASDGGDALSTGCDFTDPL